ncbi:unnamed protein product [Brassica napus]|nr:unnamed protein product [Brassica napus]
MSSFSITRKKRCSRNTRRRKKPGRRKLRMTARLYQEFVESFQGSGTKTFVRGGTINPGDKPKADSKGEKSRWGFRFKEGK